MTYHRNNELPYGGIPHKELLNKLEGTELDIDEDKYDQYARGKLIDRTNDTPFLESDHTRRDPSASRSLINLRYNGTRGSSSELPRHSEIFYGFTDKDPRGTNNDPRFNKLREHTKTRMGNLEVTMGNNDGNHVSQSPWTAQSISRARQDIHTYTRENARIFNAQLETAVIGRGFVASNKNNTTLRTNLIESGREAIIDKNERFVSGDHKNFSETTNNIRRVDQIHNTTPWKNITEESDLGVQKYGQVRGAGLSVIHTQGGGIPKNGGKVEHDWQKNKQARSINRHILAANMANATKYQYAIKSGKHEHDVNEAYESNNVGLLAGANVGKIYRSIVEDQHRRVSSEIQDDERNILGGAAGLKPGVGYNRNSIAHNTGNEYLTNVGSIVKGLREGTASGLRKIAQNIIADGARHNTATENNTRHGIKPTSDVNKLTRQVDASLIRDYTADGSIAGVRKNAIETSDKTSINKNIQEGGVRNYTADVVSARRNVRPSSDTTKVSKYVQADGSKHYTEDVTGIRKGVTQNSNLSQSLYMAEAPLIRSAAADGLVIQSYKSAPLQIEHHVQHAQKTIDPVVFSIQQERALVGRNTNPYWVSASKDQISAPDRIFNSNIDVGRHGSNAPVGPKRLRVDSSSKSAPLLDTIDN